MAEVIASALLLMADWDDARAEEALAALALALAMLAVSSEDTWLLLLAAADKLLCKELNEAATDAREAEAEACAADAEVGGVGVAAGEELPVEEGGIKGCALDTLLACVEAGINGWLLALAGDTVFGATDMTVMLLAEAAV